MLYDKKNFFINRFMHHYIRWIVGRHFHKLSFNSIEVDPQKSILLIGNHFSFWDGLILYCVNAQLLKKKLHVMMLEDTARKTPALRYAGAFSVNKNSRDVLQSINYAAGLLDDPQNLVLIFPQGKLYSNFVDQIHFEKGIWRIIEQAQDKFGLIFSATFIQYLKHKKPTATVYLKSIGSNTAYKNIDELTKAYQQHYNSAKESETKIIL
jgi:1-acyl-sn-glycerol-3-phosphate acyltransferase